MINIKSAGLDRKYVLWLPDNYDNKHPYRLVLTYHGNGGSAQGIAGSSFFGLFNVANNSAVFIAVDGVDAGWANTNDRDVILADDILKQVEDDLCIDTSRVFASGFSYGGEMTDILACTRPEVFRAVAVYAGDLGSNPSGECNGKGAPIAYYASHGTGDPWYADGGAARDYFAKFNGCTLQTPPLPPSGGHLCTSFAGCSAGHPVRWCAFDGPHTEAPVDSGQSETWNPKETWTFLSQF
jgi:poly(3-hydroxybutyrate) depolymerase